MIVLGLIFLLVYYFLVPMQLILWVGILLLIIGVVFLVAGAAGHAVVGRRHYY